MKLKKTTSRHKTRPVRVGDLVSFRFAGQKRVAQIIEDRGNIGVGGRRLLRVVFVCPHGQIGESFEVPAVEVTPIAKRSAQSSTTSSRAKVA